MIYHFKTTTKDGKKTYIKDFYLTAANHRELYRRILDQYCVQQHNVEILEEIDEESIDLSPPRPIIIEKPVEEPKKRGRRKKSEQDTVKSAGESSGSKDKPAKSRKRKASDKEEVVKVSRGRKKVQN